MKGNPLKTLIKISAFLLIANLPFLTMASAIGIDTFLDSFHHPESFQYIKNTNIQFDEHTPGYLILQKPSHQDYSLQKGDTILYYTGDGAIRCRPLYQIYLIQGVKTYYTTTLFEDDLEGPIYENQIIGKITGTLDNNPWSTLCVQVWDLSIENLNAVALFSNTE